MPDIVSDIVDVYVFRRQNARVQFLLLQRKASVPLGNTWQSFHTQIQGHESTVAAARRAVRELSALTVSEVYSADYINEFFDDIRDVVVLAPVLAVHVSAQSPITLGPELKECAWWDTNQAIARLPFAGQRWAVRHISDLMNAGYDESQLYRLHLPAAPLRSPEAARNADGVSGEETPPPDPTMSRQSGNLPYDAEKLKDGLPRPDRRETAEDLSSGQSQHDDVPEPEPYDPHAKDTS